MNVDKERGKMLKNNWEKKEKDKNWNTEIWTITKIFLFSHWSRSPLSEIYKLYLDYQDLMRGWTL